jgi:hypothetical protein
MQLRDKDGNRKPLFQNNKVWDVVHDLLNIDLKIPYITGKWTYEGVVHNAITNAGLSETAKLLGGVAADAISHMAIGIGTGGTTALNSEITDGGGERDAVTPTSETTSTSGDTIECDNTFSFTDSFAVTEEGLFNDASAGDMIAYRTFSAINVANGDSLQITHDIVMSTS